MKHDSHLETNPFSSTFTVFTGTSVIGLAPFLVVLAAKKLKKDDHPYFARCFPKFKILLILISIIFVLFQSFLMLRDYHFKSNYPNKTGVLKFTLEYEPFSIVICFPIETIMGTGNETLKNHNLKSLKSTTDDAFEKKIEFFTLNYGFKERPVKLKASDKVFFKNITCHKRGNEICLSRCFLADIHYEETRYESLLPTSYLEIKFFNEFWEVYLIDKNRPFTSSTKSFKGHFYIGKYRKERLAGTKKSNCIHYGNEPGLNCRSRHECIDRCVVRSYLDKPQNDSYKIPLFGLVDMDQLNASEQEYHFVRQRDLEIERNCENKFNKDDCIEIFFYESLKTDFSYNEDLVGINLNFEKFIEKELSQSLVKTLLNLVNLESIFFGTNVAGLLSALLMYAKKLFKFKWRPIFRYLLFALCLAGFSLHNISVFVAIIRDPLIESGFFEKLTSYHLPNPIFCFPFNESEIDKHHQLTGDYLDLLTENYLNYEAIFDKIWYFNGTHRNTFHPRNKVDENFNSEISVSHFYYLNLKCYEVRSYIVLREEDYYFLGSKSLLGVFFKSNFTDRDYKEDWVYFLYRKEGKSKQFSNSFYYDLKTEEGKAYKKYVAVFEQLEIEQNDRFEMLKNAKKLFFRSIDLNDPTIYLNQLTEAFKKEHHLLTLEVLLENYKNENLEIDDQLFRQFYMQVQNRTDHLYPSAASSKQTLYNLYTTYYENLENKLGFVFSLSLTSRISSTTNDDNWAKIIQNLVNSISLWFGSSILELHVCFSRIGQPFSFCYRLLIKFKLFLLRQIVVLKRSDSTRRDLQ